MKIYSTRFEFEHLLLLFCATHLSTSPFLIEMIGQINPAILKLEKPFFKALFLDCIKKLFLTSFFFFSLTISLFFGGGGGGGLGLGVLKLSFRELCHVQVFLVFFLQTMLVPNNT